MLLRLPEVRNSLGMRDGLFILVMGVPLDKVEILLA